MRHAECLATRGALVAALLAVPALPAHADAQLAQDKGCYNCHGNPPRKNAPTFAQLAARYAAVRGQADAEHALAVKLQEGSFFGHIDAHERLTHEDAERLVRWLIDGAQVR